LDTLRNGPVSCGPQRRWGLSFLPHIETRGVDVRSPEAGAARAGAGTDASARALPHTDSDPEPGGRPRAGHPRQEIPPHAAAADGTAPWTPGSGCRAVRDGGGDGP